MAAISKIAILLFVLSIAEAREHLIGGKQGAWQVPSSESDSLNHWASRTRFLIGDSLVWEYDASKDSVLQVLKRDYVTCNTSSPIRSYTDGNTKVKLERSGPYYFISGAEGHCEKGEKLIVVVISEKHRGIAPAHAPTTLATQSEAPSPTAPAPTSGAWRLAGSFLALGALLLSLM